MKARTNPLTTSAAACLFAASTLFFPGCGPARRDEPITRPLQTDDPRIVLGHRVFSQQCNQCHPGGAAGLAPSINDKPLPVNLMKTQVRQGLGLMPAFSKDEITDEELDAIIRYLKALRTL
jgi:mono/diheme cytochrome c family protein